MTGFNSTQTVCFGEILFDMIDVLHFAASTGAFVATRCDFEYYVSKHEVEMSRELENIEYGIKPFQLSSLGDIYLHEDINYEENILV